MVTHTYTHNTHIHTHDNYYNPRCAHAHRGLIIMIVTQDLVCNSIRSLHLGIGTVSSQSGKVHLSLNVSSSSHDCGCTVNDGGAMAAILL